MSLKLETLQEQSELLILPDGRVLAHNITPALAALLSELEPGNERMLERAGNQPQMGTDETQIKAVKGSCS